jgi:regulation of enolase protein 1 (concanavalin A-like superfamily)
MTSPALPKLRLHHGSSAMAISQDTILPDLPTTMNFPPLKISAAAKTDLWRKPPHTDVDNAPILLLSTPIDLHKFHSARVTVSADWNTLYDQGGLALFIPDEDIKKWVKTGIEFVWGKPFVGAVATSRWSDWSLVPLPESANGKVTIQVERETKGDERVESLWIYIVNEETGEKLGIREITWWFRHDILGREASEVEEPRSLLIGVYAARPTVPEGQGREQEELSVNFEGFQVTLFDD